MFDVAAWFLAPARVEYHFPGYRFRPYAQRGSDFGWHFPRYYFEAHPTRGIDLTPGGRGTAFAFAPFTFELATNSLGCRDDEFVPDGRPFLYAAGDSQTMGYVAKEQRWPDLLAQKTSLRLLNCGVAGTAQWHQRDNFLDIVGRLGASLHAQGRSGSPAALAPEYVRRPDVEIARDRRRDTAPA